MIRTDDEEAVVESYGDSTTVSSAYTLQEIGNAMRTALPNDTKTLRTHKIAPPPTRKRGYRGVELVT